MIKLCVHRMLARHNASTLEQTHSVACYKQFYYKTGAYRCQEGAAFRSGLPDLPENCYILRIREIFEKKFRGLVKYFRENADTNDSK